MSRDILSPEILVIGTRRYRINPIHEGFKSNSTYSPGYQEKDMYDDDDDDEEYEVQELENSMFRTAFHVPRAFYGALIGHKGITKKRIESETKTEIFIPGIRDTKDTLVTVRGKHRKDVCTARRRIDLVTKGLRNKTKPTHFTCVPVTNEIKKNYAEFKECIICDKYPGIDEDLFTDAEKLHITFNVCILLDDDERVKAAQILNECKDFLANAPSIEVKVSGLEIMNDDPSSVVVLYARVESPGLQELADYIATKFKEACLHKDEKRDHIKLHMTIMNAVNRIQDDNERAKPFDARAILKKYADFNFGKFTVTEVHLSQMHTTGTNGFYIASGIITV